MRLKLWRGSIIRTSFGSSRRASTARSATSSKSLCDGPSLAAWLREHRQKIEPDVAAWVTMELAEALAHAHQHAILHRDVKPANVLLKPLRSGDSRNAMRQCGRPHDEVSPSASNRMAESFPFTPKLCDFGICKVFDEDDDGRTATQTDTVVGTAAYMAPEQAAGKDSEMSPKTDVYGLGAILYEMLTGIPPIPGNSRCRHLATRLNRRADPGPSHSSRTCRLTSSSFVSSASPRNRHRRYATADLLAEDLAAFPEGRADHRAERPALGARLAVVAPLSASGGLGAPGHLSVLRLDSDGDGGERAIESPECESLEGANAQLVKAGKDKDAAAAQARELQLVAERDRAKADELLYVSDMQQAGTALQLWRHAASREFARTSPAAAQRAETYQGGEWDFLVRRGRVAHHLIAHVPQAIYFVCLSPDERYLATAGKDAVIRILRFGIIQVPVFD